MTDEQYISDIKRDLHAMMNGVASAAMRQAGMTADYRVNFGVELPRLLQLATEVDTQLRADPDGCAPDRLAQQLWNESVRECRLLALRLMPADRMDAARAEVWAAQIHTVELAQIAAMWLFPRVEGISALAFGWVASDVPLHQAMGFYTLIHLLRAGSLSPRSIEELDDQAQAALASDDAQVRAAASRLLQQLKA